MKFTQSLELALHALWFMARINPGQPMMIKDLARLMNSSESYLARVMLWLTKAEIIRSIRGKKGGFVFKRPADQITVADVVLAIDSDAGTFACTWEDRGCVSVHGCVLVELFHEAQRQMLGVLRSMTIAKMAALGEPIGNGRHQQAVPLMNNPNLNESMDTITPQSVIL